MQTISTRTNTPRGVVVYAVNGKDVASFPAWLNGHRIPTIQQARALTK